MVLKCYAGDMSGVVSGRGATLGVCQGQYQGAMLGHGIRPGCQDAMLEACWGATISIFTGEHHYRVPFSLCSIPAIITGCPSTTAQYRPSL